MTEETSSIAHPDPRIVTLVDATIGDWSTIIAVWDEFRVKHNYYLHTDVEVDRRRFLAEVYWSVLGRGHLGALLARLTERGIIGPNLNTAAAPFLGAGFNLQSYVNGQWRPQHALVGGRRLMEACDHVCRITIDGRHRGTGVLIRPNVVATAGHVVATLVDAAGEQAPDSLKRLEISFFDADDLLADGEIQPAKPITAQLHQNWLIHYSPRAPGEGNVNYPIDSVAGIATTLGPWDLALIRLGAPPRPGLSGHRMGRATPRPAEFGVHVLHHPGNPLGAPLGLLWSIGSVTQDLGSPEPLRWLHDANTDGGSSGAPCFDDDWQVVALHQAGPSVISTTKQKNRAVPIYPWANQVDALTNDVDSTPYLSHAMDEERIRTPVFGRKQLQSRAWSAMSSPGKPNQRVFVVLGDRRTGKTFTNSILTELAQRAGCRIASLDARNTQGDSVLQFAQRILGSFGTTVADAEESSSGLTTVLRNLHNDILPRLLQEVEIAAAGKPIWLVLDGLEGCDTAANSITQVIDGLIGGIKNAPHLNLVLIGWKGTVETEHLEILAHEPEVADIVDHLWLTMAPPGFEPPPAMTPMLKALVTQNLAIQPPGESYARAIAAAAGTEVIVRSLIDPFINRAPVAGVKNG